MIQCQLCKDLGDPNRGNGCRNCGRVRPRKQLRRIAPERDWAGDQERVMGPIREARQRMAKQREAERQYQRRAATTPRAPEFKPARPNFARRLVNFICCWMGRGRR